MIDKQIINIENAAKILNVSQATVRNWIKTRFLPDELTLEVVENLKSSIENGSIKKLNKRANKGSSDKNFIPSEYTGNPSIRHNIKKITELSKKYFKDLEESIYNLAICFLISRREIFELFGTLEFERNIFRKVIEEYGENKKLNFDFLYNARPFFIKLSKLDCHDVLGLLYMSIRSEGNKSKSGSYYTPIQITDDINSMLDTNTGTFFDPCCGTGSFLLSAAKNMNLVLENIYGSDIDKNAVFIAKINLLLHYNHSATEPNIFCIDILTSSGDDFSKSITGKIDAIATNPPWGASKNENLSEQYKTMLNSNEIFSMFIAKSLEIVKPKGECVFLLPESILNIKAHSNIRKILSTKTRIVTIKEFGRTFSRVFTPVILIHIIKELPDFKGSVTIHTKSGNHEINQKRFVNTKDYIFDINISTNEKNLIKKIYSTPHKTLKGNAKWALGIITGDNNSCLSNEKTVDNEPIYKGNDISYYRLNKPTNFIKYDRNLYQQVAKDEYYRAKEKLIYKFISNKLVFALDTEQSVTLNSANILIPDIPGYSIKNTLGLLNSKVFQFLFSKKFSTHKVLRSDIEQLPFPNLDTSFKNKLESLVSDAIDGKDVQGDIDDLVFKIFDLDEDQINIIKNS